MSTSMTSERREEVVNLVLHGIFRAMDRRRLLAALGAYDLHHEDWLEALRSLETEEDPFYGLWELTNGEELTELFRPFWQPLLREALHAETLAIEWSKTSEEREARE